MTIYNKEKLKNQKFLAPSFDEKNLLEDLSEKNCESSDSYLLSDTKKNEKKDERKSSLKKQ